MSKHCSVEDCNWRVKAKGLCKRHYSQHRRGTLGSPRYSAPRRLPGTPMEYGYEVKKIGGDWHRRPTGSSEPWTLVVWEQTARRVA